MINLDNWGLDVFKVADLSNNRPLTTVTYTIFKVTKAKGRKSVSLW
jgi:cAMP-specific phosphodiesterase 4